MDVVPLRRRRRCGNRRSASDGNHARKSCSYVDMGPHLFSIDAYSSEGGRVDLFLEVAYAV